MTTCKACSREIAKSAKACPHCGAKNKKPIFAKWWFWIIIVVVLVATIGNSPNSSTEVVETNDIKIEATVLETVKVAAEENEDKPIKKTETIEVETDPKEKLSLGQINALASAKAYLAFSAFSYEGLINQLEFEKYEHDEAVYAADHCGADWNEQALKSAENYLDFTAFSYAGLIKQLEFEKFTNEQATYAADNCGADWNEQAAKCAKNYLDLMSFSKDGLIGQLEFEGFTREQAQYGAEANGY